MKLIIVLLLGSVGICLGHMKFIKNYLEHKFLTKTYIFSCLSRTDKMRFSLELSKLMSVQFTLLDVNFGNVFPERLLIQSSNVGVIVNGTCPNVTSFLQQFREYKDFDERKCWLLLGGDASAANWLEGVNANPNSDLTLAIMKDTPFWDIYEVYNTGLGHGGHLVIKSIGHYNTRERYTVQNRYNRIWRRRDLGGIHVDVATMLSYSHKGQLEEYMTSATIDKDVDTLNRVGYSKVAQCLVYYNISWSTILTHSWGYPDENMSYDGIIGEVQWSRADVGTGLYARIDRLQYVDYGASVYTLENGIMFLGRGHVTPYLIYIRPLDMNVWYVLVLLVALIQIVLRIVQGIDNMTMPDERHENSWSQSIVCILGHLCQQGASEVPRLFSGRIVIFTLSQFALLLFQLYSASIVSSLLIKLPSDIHSLDDLVRSDLEFGCEDLKYVRDMFNTTNVPVLRELRQRKLREANYMPRKEGLALVNTGTFAYHTELKTAYPMIERTFSNTHVCDLQLLKLVRDANLYTNFRKRSPFRNMMNVWYHYVPHITVIIFCIFSIRRLDETGLTDRIEKMWGFRKPICFKEPYLAASVGITEFLPLATLLFVGYFLSCIVLVAEVSLHRFHRKRKKAVRAFIK